MFDIGYKVLYLEKNTWQKVFVAKRDDVDGLGIDKNKIDKITRTIRLRPKTLDIDKQLLVINKLQGFVASAQPNYIIYQHILKDIPDMLIPNNAIRISDFLGYCKFGKEVVNIVRSSELSGNIDAGLESVYGYLEQQKENTKGLESSFRKNKIIFLLLVFVFTIIPNSLAKTIVEIQTKISIQTNILTDVIFWLAENGSTLLIIISVAVLFFTIQSKNIQLFLKNKQNIKAINNYVKLKEVISFLIIFKLLHKEGLDFKKNLQIINQSQQTDTTQQIYQSVVNGHNLSSTIEKSNFPKDFKLAFTGFEQNTNLKLQINILERLMTMFSQTLKAKNKKLTTWLDLLSTIFIGLLIMLLMFGFLIPIMSSISSAI